MTIERLQDLKAELEKTISIIEHGLSVKITEAEAIQRFRSVGAMLGIHHFIVGDFAITDLNYKHREAELLATIQKLQADNDMLMNQLAASVCPAKDLKAVFHH